MTTCSARVSNVRWRAYAQAVPGAEFRLLEGAGHLPQAETPEQLLPVIWDFAEAHAH